MTKTELKVKVYCKDCSNFHRYHTDIFTEEFCKVAYGKGNYHNPDIILEHIFSPSIKNKNNDCDLFKPKEKRWWKLNI